MPDLCKAWLNPQYWKKIVLQVFDTYVKDLLDLDTFQSSFGYLKFVTLGWACSLAVECLTRMFKALCSVTSNRKSNKTEYSWSSPTRRKDGMYTNNLRENNI